MQIKIQGSKYNINLKDRYEANDQPVIEIIDKKGFPEDVLTICIPTHCFEEGETAISADFAGSDIIEQLVALGVAESEGKVAYSGHGQYAVIKLLSLES